MTILPPSSASNRDGDDREGRRAPTLHNLKKTGAAHGHLSLPLKIVPLDRTRSRSLPRRTKRRRLAEGTLLVRAPRPAAAHNGHAEGDHGQARMLAQGRVYFTRKAA